MEYLSEKNLNCQYSDENIQIIPNKKVKNNNFQSQEINHISKSNENINEFSSLMKHFKNHKLNYG